MAARDIERFNLDYSMEEIVFRWVKRGCFAFAGMALVLGVLDIAGVHSVSTAGTFWRHARANLAKFPDKLRAGIGEIALLRDSEAVVVRIAAAPPRKRTADNPVERLAAVRGSDAVETAMLAPSVAAQDRPVPVKPARPAVAEKPAVDIPAPASNAMAKADPAAPPADVAKTGSTGTYVTASAPAAAPEHQTEFRQLASLAPVTAPTGDLNVAPSTPVPVIGAVPYSPVPAIPAGQVPLPAAQPPLSPAERLDLDAMHYAKAQRCLANAIYFESRSEPVRGQMAVAQVVMNRVFSGFYPNDVCSVVYQNAHRRLACQFTFACDGIPDVVTEPDAWARARRIAHDTLDGKLWMPEVAKSTHYHAYWVRPSWVNEMKRMYKLGVHTFYRPRAWGDGSDEPKWGDAEETRRAAAKM